MCRHCLRVVAFAASVEKLKVAEAAHVQRCHRPAKRGNSEVPVPLLVFNNSFSVNIASLDAQHARLVGMINVLSESVARCEEKKVLALLLDALFAYTTAHFEAEEGLMAKHGYAGLAEHRSEHASMSATVLQFAREFRTGEKDISARLLGFLRGWFTSHILGTDRQYSAFLRERGER